jgi:hypothetical protein
LTAFERSRYVLFERSFRDAHRRHTDHFDLDIELRDASCDLNVLPARRAIAALCIGVGVDDAYFSVRELREAVSLVHENAPGGRAKLAAILSTRATISSGRSTTASPGAAWSRWRRRWTGC